MKRVIFFLGIILTFQLKAQDHPWEQLYINTSINPDNAQNGYNYIEVNSENVLHLVETEAVLNTFGGEWLLRVKQFENGIWSQMGQTLVRNVMNNEEHVDFVITQDGNLYIGMNDSILEYNPSTSSWNSFYVPFYYGGLSSDELGNIYYIHRMEGPTSPAHSDIDLAKFQNGTTTILNNIAIDFPLIPRKVNASNKIIFRNNKIYVSLVGQSTNQLVVFRGEGDEFLTKLESSQPVTSLFAGLGLSSMEVSSSGEIFLSRKSGTGNTILIDKYDELNDTWTLFDTTGIHAESCNVNRLKFDKNGVLHLIYNGSNNTGFLFKYSGSSWEHIGPKSFFSFNNISSLNKPCIAFGAENELYFSRGLGNSSIPFQVFGMKDENASIKNLNAEVPILYPNPSSDRVNLSQVPLGATVQVFSTLGELIYQIENLKSDKIEILTESFVPGVYYVTVKNSQVLFSNKLIIQH